MIKHSGSCHVVLKREKERERERGGINDSYRNRAHNGRLYKGQREVVNNDERSLQKADWMKHKRWRLEKNLFWTLFYTVMLVKAKCNLNSALTEWLVGNRDRPRGQSHTPNQFSSFLDRIFREKKMNGIKLKWKSTNPHHSFSIHKSSLNSPPFFHLKEEVE